MCTVSILPFEKGEFTLFMNRDESPEREKALKVRRRGGALYPLDPSSDGTWLGANREGLALALMNQYPKAWKRPKGLKSRGIIIPSLLKAKDAEEAASQALALDLSGFAPFLLLMVSREGSFKHLKWDGQEMRFWGRPRAPYFNCSSALDQDAVRAMRRALFERLLFEQRPASPQAGELMQELFHRSHEPQKGPDSPCMHRDKAQSVSLSALRIGKSRVKLRYFAGPPCQTKTPKIETLEAA